MRAFVWVFLLLLLSGCQSGNTESSARLPRDPGLSIQAQAKEDRIDRTDPGWISDYCFDILSESVFSPVRYERERGPNKTLAPLYGSDRYRSADLYAVCEKDYYIFPVVADAFADMEIKHTNSTNVWREFHEAVTASVSAELTMGGWEAYEIESESGTAPFGSWSRYNSDESLREYLDLFFTKDEELIFEVLVVGSSYEI